MMTRKRFSLVLLAACGGGIESQVDAPPHPDGTRAIDAPRPVTRVAGKLRDHYVSEAGLISLVPAGAEIAAISAGVHPGQIAADGSVVITDVPVGPYLLRVTRVDAPVEFLVTDTSNTFDVGDAYVGRADLQPAAAGTSLTVGATGFSAIGATDRFALFSEGASTSLVATAPATGTTFDSTYTWSGGPLVVGTKSDRLTLLHLAASTSGTQPYIGLTEHVTFPTVDMTDGAATSVSGSAATIPLRTTTMFWKRSAFAAVRTAVNPGATLARESLGATAAPYPGGMLLRTSVPSHDLELGLPLFSLITDMATTDETVSVSYGTPVPNSWTLACEGAFEFAVPLLAPGATTAYVLPALVSTRIEYSFDSIGTIEPIVLPPTGLTVAGSDGFAPAGGIGLTPTVAWMATSAPFLAVGYELRVWSLTAVTGTTHATLLAQVVTFGDHVDVPDGVLATGGAYAFELRAMAEDRALATTVSAVFTP